MNYSSILIQGSIISSEVLEKIRTEDIRFQSAKDFGLDPHASLREEISLAWSLALSHWNALKQKRENLPSTDTGTSETRQYWMRPLMSILGYELATAMAEIINGKSYAISHRAGNLDQFPVHIVGINQSLDARAESGGPRLSPHALAQEYLNHQEHLYALVSNGKFLRLIRDATRLSRLSYLEFNLEQIMEDGLYVEFALLYRLLHASRMPQKIDAGPDSILEFYHQEALASGSRIRERLSLAVETSIKALANGFLRHNNNEDLRLAISNNQLTAADYYLYNLRLVYRLLFLMVIEERRLIFPDKRDGALADQRTIYYDYYSVQRLCKLVEKMVYVDPRKTDLWQSLKTGFALFENTKHGASLGIPALGSGLFAPDALGLLGQQTLDNETLLNVLSHLVTFKNENGQQVRVNYADLDVEEFGSVYEGLLEYEPVLLEPTTQPVFIFKEGTERSKSGSHYTPEELVKPLIQHSLDYLIADKLNEKDPEAGLLSLRVCDVACGSGHILLSAARRIGFELAKLRSKEDQPSPTVMRQGVRDTIANCIYGVDKNPLAVELCKVAMWLEAHNPGEPLNFLDHHIKCGDAIVGLAHKEELEKGIASESFVAFSEDEKMKTFKTQDKIGNFKYVTVASAFAEKNKLERKQKEQAAFDFDAAANAEITAIIEKYSLFKKLPEHTPEEVASKERRYREYENDYHRMRMKQLADAQVAQFFIPKISSNKLYLLTDAEYRKLLGEVNNRIGLMQSPKLAKSAQEAQERNFFHWFLEFPEVFNDGGFDCILGNPPFLGGKKITTAFGERYLLWIKNIISEKGSSDLVGYFFRRIFSLLKESGFQSLIASNTISQGDTREVSLDVILQNGGEIIYGNKNIDWPGVAAVTVTLVSIHNGKWANKKYLKNNIVSNISAYIDDSVSNIIPYTLKTNSGLTFIGNTVLGKGFVLENDAANKIISNNAIYQNVISSYLSGDDLNTNPDQMPGRCIIFFRDWPEEKCRLNYPLCWNILVEKVKPQRDALIKKSKQIHTYNFWEFWDLRPNMYRALEPLQNYFAISRITKQVSLTQIKKGAVPSEQTVIFAFDSFIYFSLLSSSLHDVFAWKNSSTMGANTLRYSPTDCFETFPFPNYLSRQIDQQLERIGKSYHEYRRQLMLSMQLGLTKTYNAFHAREVQAGITTKVLQAQDKKAIEKTYGKEVWNLWNHLQKTENTFSIEEAITGIVQLRRLHVQMDNAVLEAYGWNEDYVDEDTGAIRLRIELQHNFYEVDYLPENDRVRYTIHPEARKEVLKRLLELNHKIHAEEVKKGLWDKKGGKKNIYSIGDDEVSKDAEPDNSYGGLFNQE